MTVGSRGEGLIAGGVALYPSSFEYPALVIKNISTQPLDGKRRGEWI